mmetsp:Transcript_30121/g.61439  ORF Transcript_30121/g.61439 Transcript_30121/m.61439 type:complete len:124 (-) Transcript_30121:7-378(-)
MFQDEDGRVLRNSDDVRSNAHYEETRKKRLTCRSDSVYSVMRVRLPFTVDEEFARTDGHCGFQFLLLGSNQVLLCEMRGHMRGYQFKKREVKFRSQPVVVKTGRGARPLDTGGNALAKQMGGK